MGIETSQTRQRFDLGDLGLLDTSPSRPLDTLVDLCADAIRAPISAFLVFDDLSASIVLRTIAGNVGTRAGPFNLTPDRSVTWLVREEASTVGISNLAQRADTRDALERRKFGAVAYLGAPVYGPTGDIVGVLAVMNPREHYWTHHERNLIANFAFLLSEHIMYRAALQTVKLMGRERSVVGRRPVFPH